ncbi:radical SAM protein [Bradyrhizobium sp. SZCCHNR1015]|uniref:radical SAM protein n=1 Tax=Bradyrhizobium sp. SZCCHNR1015 TaxID=3057338 RepID=UPI00291665B9|nr:radical SAM protein [Bradyrhizobium sp. SZCCHNR1015]
MIGTRLDCVIIGHHELPFDQIVERHRRMQKYSGGYRNLKANSILVDQNRLTYSDLLNRVIGQVRGTQPAFDVFRLPHLAAHYLASFLSKRGFAVEVVNNFDHDQDRLKELLSEPPRAVAITTTFYVDDEPIIDIVKAVRRLVPDTMILVGGPRIFTICTSHEDETQDHIFTSVGADAYVFDSQGEGTLAAVLSRLRSLDLAGLSTVPNLILATGDRITRTPRIPESNDLDRGAVDWTNFRPATLGKTAPMRTARSCAFSCSFCSFPLMAGPLSLTSLEVLDCELRALREAGVENINFIDDTFNVPLPRFKALCRLLIDRGYGFNWYSMFRCSNADDETFRLMSRAGCRGVFLGIESGSPSVLGHMHKAATVDRYERGMARLKDFGILTLASFIVGFPGETEQTVEETCAFIRRTRPDFFRAQLYYHDVRVPIHEKAAQFGMIGAGFSWSHATMDWAEACDRVEYLYQAVSDSLLFPVHGFDLESIPYLLGNGISIDQIFAFARVAQRMLVRSFGEVAAHPEADWSELRNLVARRCA